MQIYLYQNDQQIGPYTEQQIREFISAGTLQETDVCWHEGLSNWQPLNTVISFEAHHVRSVAVQHHPVVSPTEIQTNVKQGAIIGGFVCFSIGIILMFLTMWSFFIYGPLFLVAFILSIVAMAQKRILGGILLLLATLIVPTILGLYLFTTRTTEALTGNLASSTPPSSLMTSDPEPTNLPETSPITTGGSSGKESSASGTPKTEAAPIEQRAAKNAELDAKMGFRNYKLGTPIGDFKPDDIEAGEAFIKTDMKPYFAKNFDSKLGAAEIDMIQLNFDEDLLESVIVRVKGEQNALALRETLIAGYGQPTKTNTLMTKTLIWQGDDCELSFENELMGDANARFTSKSVESRIKEIKLKKAKEAAASGAGSL